MSQVVIIFWPKELVTNKIPSRSEIDVIAKVGKEFVFVVIARMVVY